MKVAFIGTHGVGKTTLCFDLAARLKEIGREEIIHKAQVDHLMGHAELVRMMPGEWNLTAVMLGAVVKTQGSGYIMIFGCMIQRRYRIHAST